jgi:hypothetical protein
MKVSRIRITAVAVVLMGTGLAFAEDKCAFTLTDVLQQAHPAPSVAGAAPPSSSTSIPQSFSLKDDATATMIVEELKRLQSRLQEDWTEEEKQRITECPHRIEVWIANLSATTLEGRQFVPSRWPIPWVATKTEDYRRWLQNAADVSIGPLIAVFGQVFF